MSRAALQVMLVDPSLFTAPYDAALTRGLLATGVAPTWAVRPIRPGDRPEIPSAHVDAFFYRWVERAVALPAPLRALGKGFAHIVGLVALLSRVRRRRPDVVHFQWTVLPLLDALAIWAIRRTCPVVLTVHDTEAFNGDRDLWLQRLAFDLPLRLSDEIIVHTEAGRATLARRGVLTTKLNVVAHGPLALAVATPAKPKSDGRFTFVLFGELKAYKGLDILVEAIGMLPSAARAQARFIVAGRARMDLRALHARIGQLALGEWLEVREGRLSELEMAALFAEADCFLFPYRQIDASGVYFLVKSLGKWLIASRIGVFAEELADPRNASLVAPGDSEALAEAMERAIVTRAQPSTTPESTSWVEIAHATKAVYQRARRSFAARVGESSSTEALSRHASIGDEVENAHTRERSVDLFDTSESK